MSNKVVLKADNLHKHYPVSQGLGKPKAHVKALNGISFELEAGKTLAVVGESGCGKSTLARQLTLIEQPTQGELFINDEATTGYSRKALKDLRTEIQMVFQNPYGSLNPRHTIAYQLTEPLDIHTNLSKEEKRDKINEMMRNVGLRPEHAGRFPHMFSGGQRQRIALARAMMLNPKIVVADEPTSALDVSIQAQVLNLFMDLQDEYRTAYVFISHNLSVVRHVADDVMVMYLGQAVEHGPKEAIYNAPKHPYTIALLAAAPTVNGQKKDLTLQGELPSPLNPPSGCALHKRCPYATSQCSEIEPQLREWDGRLVACLRLEEIYG
ncbi:MULTISPECIES: peptide ABC transporter ATP-binding protein [Psychrobacter]|uniref:Peptide ABC transporter ATP-binding protein n=1 Tax=Psychrobacter piscatorii TaxID=554343 RepID=A0A0T6DUK4_9GAMM|nr:MULTISPECIES: peptide ABC transporter ATP-binding protein [Psychrobacter]KRU23466.1 peptide ABC transporter ATP-binding protein [Psychrobacter piscatorii]MCG3882844.1 ABC transporter ATP-binding protein [Psychrobacter sp. Ps3]MDN5620498.1 ABC transporter ATP-binding protein [Psychrobacter sp.]OLF34839.1 dipeptide ABC transporter ATP-binding protein [Psychrobacter sp. C 20.9]